MNTLLNQSPNQQLFIREIEAALESEDAFGSNVEILSYDLKDSDISGRFRDVWSNRLFDYSIEKNRIGYKPSANLDSKNIEKQSQYFNNFSIGFSSLIPRFDSTSKRVKKSKCSGISYSCGVSCITLTKTCWINGGGIKVKKPGGSVASISQGRIDKLRALADKMRLEPGGATWRKYGSADLLSIKSTNLEQSRKQLFGKEVKTVNEANIKNQQMTKTFKDMSGKSISVKYLTDHVEISTPHGMPLRLENSFIKKEILPKMEDLKYGDQNAEIHFSRPAGDIGDYIQVRIEAPNKSRGTSGTVRFKLGRITSDRTGMVAPPPIALRTAQLLFGKIIKSN